MGHGTVRFVADRGVARVTLDRPQLRNAFNDEMIEDLLEVFAGIRGSETIRAVVLTGEGKAFCAGADLHWMRRVLGYTLEQNREDSLRLARMLYEIDTCPKPVVGRINGHAIGGGTGLVAVCDIAIASEEATFAFSETKLGLTPATISPYLLRKMGEGPLRELFLTAERFPARRAVELGLVNEAVEAERLDEAVQAKLDLILTGGPKALASTKELILGIGERGLAESGPFTAERIARERMGAEGQEGMSAFLEKRRPSWVAGAGDAGEEER